MKRNGNRRRGQMDWEAIFHGSRRRVTTVIIGGEADFWSRKPISEEERVRLMRRLKEYVNLSYDSEATIAKQMGANEEALTGWLAGKVKPTFQSLLKVRDFLERHVETRGGIAPVGYAPIRGNNPNGRRGKGGRSDPTSSRRCGTMSDKKVRSDWCGLDQRWRP